MIVTTEEQLQHILDVYSRFDAFAFDVETIGTRQKLHEKDEPSLDWRTNEVFWLALAGPGRADVIPMGHPKGRLVRPERIEMRPVVGELTKSGRPSKRKVKVTIPAKWSPAPDQLDRDKVFEVLEPLFFSNRVKVGANVKFDVKSTAKYYGGEPIPGPHYDVQLAAKLVWENFPDYKLENLCKREFGFEYKKLGKLGVENFAFRTAATYSYLDGKYTWLLKPHYDRAMKYEGVEDIFWDIEVPVLESVIHMEMAGAPIDVEMMRELHDEVEEEVETLQAKINEYNDGPINLNAAAQIAELVFKKRGHRASVLTPTGKPSTKASVLEKYEKDPVVRSILDYSSAHKLYSTYLHNLLPIVEAQDGYLYAEFDQLGARTSRFSCRKPNLQNIPVRTEKGKKIRELFYAPPGWVLVVADFSQIELRVLAHMTDDPMLKKAYREGLDLHRITAQRAYHVEEPSGEQRALAKNVNFSVAYKVSAKTLVERYKLGTEREAQMVIDTFYNTYKKVGPWQDKLLHEARQRFEKGITAPYVTTALGRKRRLPQLMWADRYERQKAERQAINMTIQGTAAEIAKLSVIEYERQTAGTQHQLIMFVHDELVALVPEKEAAEGKKLLQHAMESVELLSVPLVAEAKVVDRWAHKDAVAGVDEDDDDEDEE